MLSLGGLKGLKAKTVKQQSLDEQDLHAESTAAVSTSSKIAPVNLKMNFAAKKMEESNIRLDSRDIPFASNKGIDKTPHVTHKGKVSIKYKNFRKKYSIADAWINQWEYCKVPTKTKWEECHRPWLNAIA